jgi:hypothetical protein
MLIVLTQFAPPTVLISAISFELLEIGVFLDVVLFEHSLESYIYILDKFSEYCHVSLSTQCDIGWSHFKMVPIAQIFTDLVLWKRGRSVIVPGNTTEVLKSQ